jgi:hypothetical protein
MRLYATTFCRELVLMIVGMALTSAAETNSISQLSRLFVLPEPHLRAEYIEPPASQMDLQPREFSFSSSPAERRSSPLETQHSDAFIPTADRGDTDFPQYNRFHQDLGIIQPLHGSDNLVTRCFDSVFRPEEFHVGKTTVECSILTAIKRKNPFCLINPIFLNVSW